MNFKSFTFSKTIKHFFAANSGDLNKGIGNSFLSVKGVLINPGETKEILTLYFLKSKYKLSVKIS